jgi:hypothetical protein
VKEGAGCRVTGVRAPEVGSRQDTELLNMIHSWVFKRRY